MIGDISLYNGGKIGKHDSHKDGKSVDIDHSVCSIDKSGFKIENSLKLAELFKRHGAKRIFFNCKYVTDNCTIAYPWKGHHNHFHVDIDKTGGNDDHEKYLCENCYSTIKSKCTHKKEEKVEDDKNKENNNDDKKS